MYQTCQNTVLCLSHPDSYCIVVCGEKAFYAYISQYNICDLWYGSCVHDLKSWFYGGEALLAWDCR